MIRALVILSGLAISGCDVSYGVSREAAIPEFIDHKCIEKSLRSVSEVTVVTYDFMAGNPGMTKEMKEEYALHRYHYTVSNVNSFVSVLTNNNGTKIILFSRKNRQPPSQEDINIIRPIMDKVQVAISGYCKIYNFFSLVKETCTKVKCA